MNLREPLLIKRDDVVRQRDHLLVRVVGQQHGPEIHAELLADPRDGRGLRREIYDGRAQRVARPGQIADARDAHLDIIERVPRLLVGLHVRHERLDLADECLAGFVGRLIFGQCLPAGGVGGLAVGECGLPVGIRGFAVLQRRAAVLVRHKAGGVRRRALEICALVFLQQRDRVACRRNAIARGGRSLVFVGLDVLHVLHGAHAGKQTKHTRADKQHAADAQECTFHDGFPFHVRF